MARTVKHNVLFGTEERCIFVSSFTDNWKNVMPQKPYSQTRLQKLVSM